ncbi:hypothetical protein BJX76DRAFT_318953 [Aspergillus varians]
MRRPVRRQVGGSVRLSGRLRFRSWDGRCRLLEFYQWMGFSCPRLAYRYFLNRLVGGNLGGFALIILLVICALGLIHHLL